MDRERQIPPEAQHAVPWTEPIASLQAMAVERQLEPARVDHLQVLQIAVVGRFDRALALHLHQAKDDIRRATERGITAEPHDRWRGDEASR